MVATFDGRRAWIKSDTPSVEEVLDIFPPLKESNRLHRELTLITVKDKTHNFLEDWPNWLSKIIGYGLLEARTRTTIQTALTGYDELEDSDDVKAIYTFGVLKVLLANRAKDNILHTFKDTVGLDGEVEKLPPFPQIIVLRMAEEQFFIAVEKQVVVESRCINTALLDMMSVYFTFDITYPKPLYSLLFIQHLVLNIRDSQPVPNNVTVF